MSVSQHELAQQFADENPNAASFQEGVYDQGQVRSLTGALHLRLYELSEKDELNSREISFIEKTADLSARCLQHLVEQMGMALPDNKETRELLDQLVKETGEIEGSSEHLPKAEEVLGSKVEFVNLLAALPAQFISLRHNSQLRHNFENYAIANLGLLNNIADYYGGLKVDHYLEGNIQNIISHLRLSEAD